MISFCHCEEPPVGCGALSKFPHIGGAMSRDQGDVAISCNIQCRSSEIAATSYAGIPMMNKNKLLGDYTKPVFRGDRPVDSL
jgi:hypothetical protein